MVIWRVPKIQHIAFLCVKSLRKGLQVAPYTIQRPTVHVLVMNTTHHIIDNYTPRTLDATAWSEMEGFVRETIRTRYAHGRTERAIQHGLATLSAFADWVLMTGVGGMNESILRANIIDTYTSHRHSEVDGPVAERERKRLRAIAGLRSTPEQRTIATTSTPSMPYNEDEQGAILRWAEWQPTDVRRRSALGIVALGLGCGLTGTEMLQVRCADIVTLDDGLLGVQLPDRTVPVLSAWHDELSAARSTAADAYLVGPDWTLRTAVTLGAALQNLGPNSPSAQRLRATWLLTHVNASTNIYSLMSAAGLSAPDFLRRLAAFADHVPASAQPAAFRLSMEVK
ncbi:hypothetical protein ACTJKH_07415 [Microbacterium sp. 22215]